MAKIKQKIINEIKEQTKPESLVFYAMGFIFLSFLTYVSYSTGFHNGEITQCIDLGRFKANNGECVNEYEIDWKFINGEKSLFEKEIEASYLAKNIVNGNLKNGTI